MRHVRHMHVIRLLNNCNAGLECVCLTPSGVRLTTARTCSGHDLLLARVIYGPRTNTTRCDGRKKKYELVAGDGAETAAIMNLK